MLFAAHSVWKPEDGALVVVVVGERSWFVWSSSGSAVTHFPIWTSKTGWRMSDVVAVGLGGLLAEYVTSSKNLLVLVGKVSEAASVA